MRTDTDNECNEEGSCSAPTCSPPGYQKAVDSMTEAEKAQRLAEILRAEAHGNDLHEDTEKWRLVVCREDESGDCWSIGHIDLTVARELKRLNRPDDLRRMIERVKFGWMVEPLEEND
jgi:hypothetical protein